MFKRSLTPPSLPQAMNCPSSIHHFNSVFLCSIRGFHRSKLPVVYRHLFSLRARSLVWDLCYSAAAHYNIGDRFWKKLLSPRTGLNFFRPYFHYSPSSVHYCEGRFHVHPWFHFMCGRLKNTVPLVTSQACAYV